MSGKTVRLSGYSLHVSGLRELRATLRSLDEALPAELRGTNKRVVDEIIVPRARAGAEHHRPAAGYNARTGRSDRPDRHASHAHWADVVNSIRGVASQTSAAILFGSTAERKKWIVAWEFGSMGNNRPPHSNKSQFPPHRGAGKDAGYFFFPAIRQSGPEIVSAYEAALDRFLAAKMPQG
jgi:hypothetical protein